MANGEKQLFVCMERSVWFYFYLSRFNVMYFAVQEQLPLQFFQMGKKENNIKYVLQKFQMIES